MAFSSGRRVPTMSKGIPQEDRDGQRKRGKTERVKPKLKTPKAQCFLPPHPWQHVGGATGKSSGPCLDPQLLPITSITLRVQVPKRFQRQGHKRTHLRNDPERVWRSERQRYIKLGPNIYEPLGRPGKNEKYKTDMIN